MNVLIHKFRSTLLLVALCALPWFFLPFTQEYFLTHKFYLLLGVVDVSLLLIAISVLLGKKISLIKTSFDKVLIIFGVTQVLAVLLASTNKVQALTSLPWGLATALAGICLYFILVNTFAKKSGLVSMMNALYIGTIFASLITILFWFGPLQKAQLPQYIDFLKNMRFSPIGNVLDVLIVTGLLSVISVISILQKIRQSKKASVLSVVGMLVGLSALILVGYRAMYPPQGQQAFQLPPFGASWVAGVETMKSLKTGLVGVGIDNYEAAFTAAKPRDYNQSDVWQINFNLASSMLLHLWTETGILGLVAYLLIWIYIIREVNGLFAEKDPDAKTYAAWAVYMGIITLVFPISFYTYFFTLMLCAGLGIKAHQYSDESMVVDISKMPILYVSIAIILLVLAGGLGYFGSRAYAAEMYFKKSVDGIRANSGQDVYNNLVKAIQTNPYIERYHVQFGQVNLLLANNISKKKDLKDQDRQDIARFIQVAISEAKVPVQLNPNKVGYWNNLAVVYRNIINVAQGAESWTVASYRRAIVLDPNNPLLRLNLGGVYYSLKNYGEAESLFGQAAALKPDWANAFYNLSWAQFQGKKYDAAVANLENALKILDKKSPDYKKANENLEAFKAAAADTKKNAKTASESAGIQKGEELALPEKPNVQLSPALELPKGTGPENEIKVTPTPTASAPTTSVTPVISPAVIATPGA